MERVKYKKSATWKNRTLQQHLTALLTIVAKLSILDTCWDSGYTSRNSET